MTSCQNDANNDNAVQDKNDSSTQVLTDTSNNSILITDDTSDEPNNTKAYNPFAIKPPVKGVNVPYHSYEVKNNQKDSIFIHKSGSSIHVPANAFVYADGRKPKEVYIDYREFHTPGEIILSGIPMKWDSAGTIVDFVTGGMFEFVAKDAAGTPLKFAKGKKVQIDLVSKSKDTNYNFYALAENEGWNQLKKHEQCAPISEEEYRVAQSPKTKITKPIQPQKAEKDKQLINLQEVTKMNHEYKVFAAAFWQAVGQDSLNTKKINAITSQQWKRIKIEPDSSGNNSYNLELYKNSTKVSFTAKPVFVGKMFNIASDAYKAKLQAFNNYSIRMKNARKSYELADKFNSLMRRTTAVSSNGIYNYDRQLKRPSRTDFIASFKSENPKVEQGSAMIYLIAGDSENAIIKFPLLQWKLFAVDFTEKNFLISIDEKGKVAILDNQKLKQINANNKFNKTKRNEFLFSLLDHDLVVKTAEDLDNIISSI